MVSQRQPLGMNYDLAWIDEILNDADTEPEIREKRAEIVRRYRAVMAVPLIVRDEPMARSCCIMMNRRFYRSAEADCFIAG